MKKKPKYRIMFKGVEYNEPFHCLCCGKRVSPQQFAFGRSCAPCDLGLCQHEGSVYWHPLLDKTGQVTKSVTEFMKKVESLEGSTGNLLRYFTRARRC
jgi:hypothetical protein